MHDLKAVCFGRWIFIVFTILLLFFVRNGHCCGSPAAPEDGYFIPFKPKYGNQETVRYACNDGFSLKVQQEADMYNRCINNIWTNANLPSCVKNPECGAPGTPANGILNYNSTRNVVRYTCKPGYFLLGNNTRTCSRSEIWTPNEMPKCVANLAFQKPVSQVNTKLDTRQMVDGDFTYCNNIVKTASAFEFGIDLGRIIDFTNILFSFRNGSVIAVGLKSSNESTSVKDRHKLTDFNSNYVSTPLWFNTSSSGNPIRSQKAKYIFIEPISGKQNDFGICEIQMFNSLETTGCGTPDAPSNGIVINRFFAGNTRFIYQCNKGYTLYGPTEALCSNGQWTSPPPTCRANPTTTTFRPTTRPTTTANRTAPTTTTTTPTPIKPTSTDEDTKDKVINIMAIAIGATVASIAIVVSILIVVCIMKRYYKKKSRLPNCHAEHGSLCTSPHSHYPMYKDYSQPRSQDGSQHSYGEPPIHLYDSIREHDLRFPLQRPSPDYDLSETVFNEGYGRRPPLPVPRPTGSSSGGSQQYEPLMPVRRNSNPYDEVNEDLVPSGSGRNEPDIMTSSRVDSLYIKGAPRTAL